VLTVDHVSQGNAYNAKAETETGQQGQRGSFRKLTNDSGKSFSC
jgi:hypothetical protein